MRKALTAVMAAMSVVVASSSISVAATAPARPTPATHAKRPTASAIKTNAVVNYTFFAGGATLPAVGYVGTAARTTNPVSITTGTSTGTGVGFWLNNLPDTYTGASYCLTGSGTGKKVIDGTNAASGACSSTGPGFASTNTYLNGTTNVPYADFAGSDAPLAVTEYNAFTTNTMSTGTIPGRGIPVQIPVLVGAIAIAFNYQPSAGSSMSPPYNISSLSALCNVFDGNGTTFGALFGQTGTDSTPIAAVVYRSDGSGTTFNFSNFLNKQCGSTTLFNVDQLWTNVWLGYGSTLPSNFVGESGNQNVANEIDSTANSIGYVEAANFANPPPTNVHIAEVEGTDPYANLPKSANTLTTSGILVDEVLPAFPSPAPTAPYRPTPVSDGSTAGCVLMVDPTSYDNIQPGVGALKKYPIIAVTNLEFSSAKNPYPSALQALPTDLLTPTNYADNTSGGTGITTIDSVNASASVASTGYSSLPAAFLTGSGSPVPTAISCIGS
jgi:phosphate transport system substrate-binding protein